jgi:hypothetical protein
MKPETRMHLRALALKEGYSPRTMARRILEDRLTPSMSAKRTSSSCIEPVETPEK